MTGAWNKLLAVNCHVGCAEDELRAELKAAARRLGEAAKYRSAGTIEFLVDQDTSKFYFLEVNTRLQVRTYTRRQHDTPIE